MGDNFAKRISKAVEEAEEIGFQAGYQCACDLWPIAIAMSEKAGPVKIIRISELFDELYAKYGKAWLPSDPEADWMQEQIDAKLKLLYLDRFVPFYERNEYIQRVKYGKKRNKR